MSFPRAVLFLCDYQAPYGGSFLPSLRALEAALQARGTQVVWVFPAGARTRDWLHALDQNGRTLAFLDGSRLQQLSTLDKLVKAHHIGLIHAHFGLFPLAYAEALLHPSLRVVLHVHSDFSGGKKSRFFKRLLKAFIACLAPRRIRRVMVGAHMAKIEKNAVCIENGVDFSRAAASTETREQARARLGIPDTAKLVLLFGWSPYIKGVDIAARAVALLKEEGFLLGLVCGREMTASKLLAWLTAHGCDAEGVRLLAPVEDVFAYHRAADIMLSASRSETFSYALAEALYAERPCVMSDIPGTRWAAAYETVTVFPAGDASAGDAFACAAALKKAAEGFPPAAYARARDKVEAACSLSRWVDGVLAVYASMN